MIVFDSKFTGRRLRARRVDEESCAIRAKERALEKGDWVALVDHGGGVANSYNYPAETECVLALSDPLGNVVCWVGRAPANKVTDRGAAKACVRGAGDLFDDRIKNEERLGRAFEALKRRHREVIPEMMVIADAAR